MMNRRYFLGSIGSLLVAADRPRSFILVTEDEAERMRDAAKGHAGVLEKLANSAMKAGPWSVTFKRPTGVKVDAGPNDYYSEGPYWWPDPKNPGGPYIRKDGEQNPNRFTGNRNDLGNMCETVLALGMGAFLLNKAACAEHAAKILSVWFLDGKTRMNPNLEYGQAVRGINTGRGTGIIDTVSLIHGVQGIALLELAGGLDKGISAGLRQWYADYMKWMNTSSKGLDEKKSGNNHATWWTAQVASYAAFTNDTEARRMAWDHYRNYLVPTEIKPDGSCPREEARTKSLGYSSMNLDAFSVICRVAELDGVDLWRFHTDKGVGVEKCFDYLMPYLLQPDTWRKQQIANYSANGYVFPALAAMGLHSRELLAGYRKLPRAETAWVQFIDLVTQPGSA
jgi:Alginate lyase